jgi:hypothetical protein
MVHNWVQFSIGLGVLLLGLALIVFCRQIGLTMYRGALALYPVTRFRKLLSSPILMIFFGACFSLTGVSAFIGSFHP